MSLYDKEIAYYTQAPASDIGQGLFQRHSVQDFVTKLDKDRQAVIDVNDALNASKKTTQTEAGDASISSNGSGEDNDGSEKGDNGSEGD